MNSPNREEFEARLAELDARQSGRLDAIEAKLDALRDQVASFWRAVVERFEQLEARTKQLEVRAGQLETRTAQLESQTARVETRLAGVEASLGEVRQYLRGLKITVIVTGLSVVFGIAAINVSSISNLLTAFGSGRETALAQASLRQQMQEIAATQAEMRRQSEETRAELRDAGILRRHSRPQSDHAPGR